MKHVHIECLPDEYLVRKLGFTRKYITHHQGKSRVFHALSKNSNQLAMVDEDPGSVKTSYEKSLQLKEEDEGIKYFADASGNIILFLNGKLEDWVVNICRIEKIKLQKFGLAKKPDELHDQINQKLPNFDRVLTELLKRNNPSILKLKAWLT
jgi:hypothetical protein